MTSRRDFLKWSATIGAGSASLGIPGLRFDPGSPILDRIGSGLFSEPARRQLRVLILGGTGFIGPHLVNRVVGRGHELTIFNRGRSEPRLHAELFTDLENLVGDRDGEISALAGREWDVVIDNSGYTPDQVGATARLLAGSVGQYIFTSTRGVYAGFTHSPMDEDAPVGIAGVPESEWTGYGPLKALAEREVEAAFPDGTSIVRPPIITGPGDNTDRFTFWYYRVDQGGEVMAPGSPDDPIQYVDVRDLADFVVHMAEERIMGTFNVEAPAAPLTTAEFLHGLRATTGSPVSFTWVDWDFLASHDAWSASDLAAWRPPHGENLNYGRVDNRRAIEAGMTFRPLALTAMDTLAWWQASVAAAGDGSLDGIRPRSGHSPEAEARILADWAARG